MSGARKSLGMGALAVLCGVCCVGIPLIVVAGVSVALAVWVGGIVVGGIVLFAAAVVLGLRLRRRHTGQSPSVPVARSRS